MALATYSEEMLSEEIETEISDNNDETYVPPQEQHLITQVDLNDLVRDLNLPIDKAELLGSRLKQWKRWIHCAKFLFIENGI